MFKSPGLISSFIKRSDFFTSPVTLRYKLDQDYNTFAGGLISILLIILLFSVFYSSWLSLLNKTDITLSTATLREFDPSILEVNSEDFMFGIGVTGMNLSDSSEKKYFNFSMNKVEIINQGQIKITLKTPFLLEACQLHHWQHLGSTFVQRYTRLKLSSFLCPPRNTSMEIGGKWTSQKFVYFQIKFDKCKGQNCRTQDQIDQFLRKNKAFYFDFFYSNTLLNPDQTKPISMLLEDKDYVLCSPKLSIDTNIYLGQYTMKTDQSIFPWDTEEVKKGFIVNRAEKDNFNFIPNQNDPYCRLFLRKSDVKLQIERKFRKIDEILSYIGGLFGILCVTLGVIMKYYGQCSFELQMCQKIFDYHNKKHSQQNSRATFTTADGFVTAQNLKMTPDKVQVDKVIEPKDFVFLDFLIYILVYIPLKKICNIKWKKMEVYEESLEEMRYKLDISQLMEKLNFYDRSINVLFDESQLKLLYLQDKFLFQEVREQRKMLGLREDINANLFESKENRFSEVQDLLSSREYKKPLKELAQMKSKRLGNLISSQITEEKNMIIKKNENGEQGQQNASLTAEIKTALKLLDEKIEEGDVVSTRIYNGLQYELLEAYEKSKTGEHKYTFIPISIVNFERRAKDHAKTLNVFIKSKDRQEVSKRLKTCLGIKKKQSDIDFLSQIPAGTSINELKNSQNQIK